MQKITWNIWNYFLSVFQRLMDWRHVNLRCIFFKPVIVCICIQNSFNSNTWFDFQIRETSKLQKEEKRKFSRCINRWTKVFCEKCLRYFPVKIVISMRVWILKFICVFYFPTNSAWPPWNIINHFYWRICISHERLMTIFVPVFFSVESVVLMGHKHTK